MTRSLRIFFSYAWFFWFFYYLDAWFAVHVKSDLDTDPLSDSANPSREHTGGRLSEVDDIDNGAMRAKSVMFNVI